MKLIDIVGARPQFIKLASVLKEVMKNNKIKEVLVHTGQHYDYEMSELFFKELGLKNPDYHLGIGSGSHAYQTAEMMKKIEDVLIKEKPDLVMVYGDTNSTLAGALTAAKLHIKVAHVEAGLRSFNKRMPEEINRILTDHMSNLLFCPTDTAIKNLRNEGINEGVYLVGDVMYDAVIEYSRLAEKKSHILENLLLSPKSYALSTIHRAENTEDKQKLINILNGLDLIAEKLYPVIFPVHPRTINKIKEYRIKTRYIKLIKPISYLDMLILEKNANIIITDSGGIQKEAFFFKVPCITLRDETEWVETIETGWNRLANYEPTVIFEIARDITSGIKGKWPYGNGNASYKIVSLITKEISCLTI